MITQEQILNASGDELSKLAGEVLRDVEVCAYCSHHDQDWDGWSCRNKDSKRYGYSYQATKKACDLACGEPIPLTWPEAMKYRDLAVKEFGCVPVTDACLRVALSMEKCTYSEYIDGESGRAYLFQRSVNILDFTAYALPEHYIKAACLCKLGKE